jgi:hypothetical protein
MFCCNLGTVLLGGPHESEVRCGCQFKKLKMAGIESAAPAVPVSSRTGVESNSSNHSCHMSETWLQINGTERYIYLT